VPFRGHRIFFTLPPHIQRLSFPQSLSLLVRQVMCTSCQSPLVFDVPPEPVFIACWACDAKMLIRAMRREETEVESSPDGTPVSSPDMPPARASRQVDEPDPTAVSWKFPEQERIIVGRMIPFQRPFSLNSAPNPMLASVR
jgi:hypothetical protein